MNMRFPSESKKKISYLICSDSALEKAESGMEMNDKFTYVLEQISFV